MSIKNLQLALVRNKKLHSGVFRGNSALYIMLLPAVLLSFIFSYIPMFGIIIAFKDYKPWTGIIKSPWVGLENFKVLFATPDSFEIIRNTVIIASMKIVVGLIVPCIFALLLNEVRSQGLKRGIQTMVYFPHFLSWVILGGIFIDIFSPTGGLINQIIGLFGIKPVFFLGEPGIFRYLVVITDVWKEFGFSAVIYIATILGINPSLYEAAEVDGASRWKQTLYVTLPGLLPMVAVVGTLSLGNILNAGFDQIFNLYNSLVYSTGDVIETFTYRMGLAGGQFSIATAMGLFNSVVGTTLIVISYRLAYKYGNYRIF